MSELKLWWGKIEKRIEIIPESGCWIFMGCLNSKGYGNVGHAGKNRLAHRISLEFHKGIIPAGLLACHRCDVKCCVNPNHIYAGTRSQNAKDALERGQMATGIRNGWAKISDTDVLQIRLLAQSGMTYREVASRFGISADYVKEIKIGKRRAPASEGEQK
ncbi:hypothetical protein FOC27_09225 [Burkholderia multivorans]|uniref:HNH endonuclease signature motif containing protein n=1 Tax=Burkholderia multivorans TaxID=87883 RepID=UPI0012DB3C9E|nr:HNH endonuclease signature motif containing protein [Burkholderia multivorans]MCA8385310.1 HNH endonuclease [Burkholderia multivorans]MDN7511990.1 HNH endonuclease signature motif containing protein [Burkholderia multivorans]QGR60388.1 hypothetical protein FOC27_09225 [Burkholderia multivorans]